jgi:hypothetical protein
LHSIRTTGTMPAQPTLHAEAECLLCPREGTGRVMTRIHALVIAGVALVLGVVVLIIFMSERGGRPETSEDDLRRRLDQLRSVPYTSVTESPVDQATSGVVVHDRDRAWPGYNIYCSRVTPEAYLMDMKGEIVHTWTYPPASGDVWDYAIMLDGGDLVVIEKYISLFRLDWNSNLVWRWKLPVHHDVVRLGDGTFYVIWLGMRSHSGLAVRFPSIVHLDEKGKEIDKWSTHEHLDDLKQALDTRSFLDTILDSLYAEGYTLDMIEDIPGPVKTRKWKHGRKFYDYFHMNTISVLPDTPLGRRDPRFKAGNIMTCFRHVNQVVILEKDTWRILWAWGEGELEWPHHPTMLESGNILIYDNGIHRKATRILELNPAKETVEWRYSGDPPESFYSEQKGSAQRLPNGNTLICDADNGRSFEVTEDGEIVWEWFNPALKDSRRVQVYRMLRLAPEVVDPLLAGR